MIHVSNKLLFYSFLFVLSAYWFHNNIRSVFFSRKNQVTSSDYCSKLVNHSVNHLYDRDHDILKDLYLPVG